MKVKYQLAGTFLLTFALNLNCFSQTNISDQLQPVELSNVKLAGILGQRFENNLTTRVKNKSDLEIYLSYYEHPVDSFRWFSGEHVGKWLISACNSWKYSRDPELKQLIDECMDRWLKCQLENGYLGSQKVGYRFYDLDWNKISSTKKQEWNFDTWNHSLTMMGLLTHYETFQDKRSLVAAKKIAHLYMETFGGHSNRPNTTVFRDENGKVDLAMSVQTQVSGSGATCIIYPFAWLYRLEGNKEYLEFCDYIKSLYYEFGGPKYFLTDDPENRQSFLSKGCFDFLNFLGFIDLYKKTGSNIMLVSGQNMFHQFTEVNKITKDLGVGLNYLCDICPPVIFGLRMLELTGDPYYANILEPMVYNSINAFDEGSSCGVANFASFDGNNTYRCMAKGMSGFCCYSMTAMMISYYPELFYMKSKDGNGIVVNFYESSSLTTTIKGTNISLKQETLYPLDGTIQISVDPDKRDSFNLVLRVPLFCDNAEIKVNGKDIKQKIVIGQYVTISREWGKGDKIDMNLVMPAKLKNYKMQTLKPNFLEKMKEKIAKEPGARAIQKGPLALVYDANFNPNSTSLILKTENDQIDLKMKKNEDALSGYVFVAQTTDPKKPIVLLPYGDAGKKDNTYKVWFNTEK